MLNSTHPDAPETKQLAEGMARDYDHTVLPVSCVDLDAEALGSILRQVLYEFPVQELDFALPRWVTMLENGHWLQTQVYDAAMQLAAKVSRMKDVPPEQTHLRWNVTRCSARPSAASTLQTAVCASRWS